MRIRITLKPKKGNYSIPINYNYPLSSAIYKFFYESSPKFSKWLHDHGFVGKDGKKIKLFTFSRLFMDNPKINGKFLEGKGECRMLFSSPFDYMIVENLIFGMMKFGVIKIANQEVCSEFYISKIEKIEEPVFYDEMQYIMLSPTVASTFIEKEGYRKEHFYRVDEVGVEENLVGNLLRKYELVHKKQYNGKVEIELDREYIKQKGGSEGVSKLITIAEGHKEETKVKGFICPIKIFGEPEIQKIAYDCGIGRKNSMGFGMLEPIVKS